MKIKELDEITEEAERRCGMIKVEILDVHGFEPAIHAMRNPKNSWNRSDSEFCYENPDPYLCVCDHNIEIHDDIFYRIGENDLGLMQRLFNAGVEHRTYARMIQVWMDIEAPLYWWKEMDRYTVGKVQISTSTMHKIHSRDLTIDDFSHEHLNFLNKRVLENTISVINDSRTAYQESNNREEFMQMIQLLPSSYNQKRTVMMSYETVFKIIKERSNHPLDEWLQFVEVLKDLPYMQEIMDKSVLGAK